MGSPQESYTGSQSCRVMADLVGGHQSSARALDGGWEVPARCYADFRGLSERRANTRSPACVSAPSEAFPRLAHRRMASATSALVACCSPSGVFLQTRSNATSIFARVRISKLLSIVASAHSRPDGALLSVIIHASRNRCALGRAVDNVQHSSTFSVPSRTFSLTRLALWVSSCLACNSSNSGFSGEAISTFNSLGLGNV
jgi:hypothetical protein